MENKNKGITLITLTITVVVLIILAGIAISSGGNVIRKAKLEELKTNMLLIQAKAKSYVEEATFKMGINPNEEKKIEVRQEIYESETGAQLEKAETIPTEFAIEDSTTCYWLTPATQEKWGLNKIEIEENEKYLIQFDETNLAVEVYNTKGYEGKYSLKEIDNIQE